MSTRGFTLLEILGVLLVVGILSAIGIINFLSYQRILVLRQAATQVATDLNRIRTEARRTSQSWILWADSANSYIYGPQSSTPSSTNSGIVVGQGRAATLPTGTQLAFKNNNWISFTAPYGLNASAATQSITLSRTDSSPKQIGVNVIGIIGKVVVREQ
ncbi:MAG: prepilin-type N-terminal cleavage/methylation domain-containing protein [Thermaceae bacterium]|nr:prepilin-type N-terminal cleavage/methylation domain-containing protein [Thermaceae bacterium]